MVRGDGGGRWLARYRQRLAYLLIAASLVFTLTWTTIGGFRLHHAVLIERQTLRTQQFSQATLELQNIALDAEATMGVSPALATKRAQAVAAADAAFANVQTHDAAEAARLATAYDVYVARSTAAFIAAGRNAGVAPNTLELLVQRSLSALEELIGVEMSNQAARTQKANPSAR